MNVHIAGSRYEIIENIENLRRIIDAVHEEGHSLDRDWIEPTYQSVKQGKEVPDLDWTLIYQESLEAIHRADVVIADSTIPSFSVGFQVATALQMKKPVLILNKDGVKNSPFPSGIAVGVSYKSFTEDTLKPVVKDFLHENDIQLKDMRFNFFIDRPIYNYLRWAAHKTGKTKAEILRELVLREIEKQ